LVQLAIYIFNFVPNSASCERLFSDMGNIKTKKRNRLSVKKTRDCAFLKGELRRRHAKEGTARQRLKHQFGNKPVAVLDGDPTGSRLEEEEFLRQLDVAGESENSDGDDSESNLPEYVIDPDLRQRKESQALVVAKQLVQAVDDDNDASDSDIDEDIDGEPPTTTTLRVPKVRLSS
jgi:hypothetical protein